MSQQTVLIAGAGLGGLFTGALLAVNGYRVTVAEKNAIIGGGLQCFSRHGKSFETGMHIVGGFQPDGTLDRLCKYLGIRHKVNLQTTSHRIIIGNDAYDLPSGRREFAQALQRYFPHEAQGIKQYVQAIFDLARTMPTSRLQPRPDTITLPPPSFFEPYGNLIDRYTSDGQLRKVLNFLSHLYAGEPSRTPAFAHCMINALFIESAQRFVNGGQHLAQALRECIEEHGGSVLTDSPVKSILCEGPDVKTFVMHNGRQLTARWYIWAANPVHLTSLVHGHELSPRYIKRLNGDGFTTSAFELYLDLKPGTFPYLPETIFVLPDSPEDANFALTNSLNPASAMVILTPPTDTSTRQTIASHMVVFYPMSYDEVRHWEGTESSHRGDEYERWKQEKANRILRRLQQIFPGIENCISHLHTASPLTIRDYYNAPQGNLYGYAKSTGAGRTTRLSVQTPLNNLLLTGQNVFLHGICGVPLTALLTAEKILGRNHIIRQINNSKPC